MRSVLSRGSLVAMVVFLFVSCLVVGSAAAGPKPPPPGSPPGLKLPSQADWIMGYTRAGINAYNSVKTMRNGAVRRGRTRGNYRPYRGTYKPYYPQYDPHNPWTPDPWTPDPHAWNYHAPGNPPPAPEGPPENPWPATADQPGMIGTIDSSFNPMQASAIVNPQSTGVVLRYLFGGTEVQLPPGHYQNLGREQTWTVEFDSGGSLGKHRYSISDGLFEFTPTPDGWELFRKKQN